MKPTAEMHTARLRRIVRGEGPEGLTGQPDGGAESAGKPAPRPDDILHDVDQVLKRLPHDEVGDPDEFRKAVDIN